jgi:C1A family cysteine protease
MKGCLADGFPFVLGFSVYSSFESDEVAKTGIVPLPQPNEEQCGGHAVLCVGYNDATQNFLVRNSWGSSWGQGGHFWINYSYLTNPNLASDFWTLRTVETGEGLIPPTRSSWLNTILSWISRKF